MLTRGYCKTILEVIIWILLVLFIVKWLLEVGNDLVYGEKNNASWWDDHDHGTIHGEELENDGEMLGWWLDNDWWRIASPKSALWWVVKTIPDPDRIDGIG